MNNNTKIIISLYLIFHFLFAEKNSTDIQNDINNRNKELNKIKDEIILVEQLINSNIKEESENKEIINKIEKKINLTEKLIGSLNKEEIYLSNLINKTENRILIKEQELFVLQNQLKNRIRYLYKNGRKNIISELLKNNSFDNTNYRIKYLKILNQYENEIKIRINNNLNNLKLERESLTKEKNRKKYLLKEKNLEFINLEKDRKLKNEYLNKIKSNKKNLEQRLELNKRMMVEVENIIQSLYNDKTNLKKREADLAKIRAKQNKSTSGNFAKMKCKLSWPTNGEIISKFGIQTNDKLNTLYENIGIDILSKTNASVYSVLDGVVSSITYIIDYGNVIIIDHGDKYFTVYSNVDNILVNENEYVQSNIKIAEVTTNQKNKYILHFEVWGNKNKLDPLLWLKKL